MTVQVVPGYLKEKKLVAFLALSCFFPNKKWIRAQDRKKRDRN